jgi:hypothetical protein
MPTVGISDLRFPIDALVGEAEALLASSADLPQTENPKTIPPITPTNRRAARKS